MRHFYLILLLCVTSLCAQNQTLPVLKVTFPDPIKKNMPYSYGSMLLTNTDGSTVSLTAKFKTRGATAQQYLMKPSLNMKLRDAQDNDIDTCLLGIRTTSSYILDAMAIDRINMRNRVCFDIWNELDILPYETDYGRNGTLGRFIELYINDTYYGIYCMSDKINRRLLDLKKVKEEEDGTITPRGVLYKQGTNDLSDQNTPGFFLDTTVCVVEWHNAWELTEPDDYPSAAVWQPLIDLFNNKTSYSYIKNRFYLNNLIDYQLMVMALCLGDSWGNKNKFLSIRNITKSDYKFILTPWDMDSSIGGNYNGAYYDGNYKNDWSPSEVVGSAVDYFATCNQQAEYREMLKNRWRELRGTNLSVQSVSNHLNVYASLLVQSGAWSRQWNHFSAQKYPPRLVEDLQREVNMIIEWYRNRCAQMDDYFGVTDLENTSVSTGETCKSFQNGQLIIHHNGTNYNVLGTKL